MQDEINEEIQKHRHYIYTHTYYELLYIDYISEFSAKCMPLSNPNLTDLVCVCV